VLDHANAIDELEAAQARRFERFQRRQLSGAWLIGLTREQAGLVRDRGQDDEPVRFGDAQWRCPDRPAKCSMRLTPFEVGVHCQPGATAFFTGLLKCGSVWACPPCSAVIRSQRAKELRAAYQRIMEDPELNPGVFLTLTLRHNRQMSLNETLDVLLKAFQRMQSWRKWRETAQRLGIVGNIKSLEITCSPKNGWHPHLHVWLITGGRVSGETLADAQEVVFGLWQRAVEKVSGGLAMVPTDKGLDMRRVTSRGITGYVAKLQDDKGNGGERSLASEMVRSDLKTGTQRSAIVPFELLDKNNERNRALWLEYYCATKYRNALTWSRGLRARLGLGEERCDSEIVNDAELHSYFIPAKKFDKGRECGSAKFLHETLMRVETGQRETAPPASETSKVEP